MVDREKTILIELGKHPNGVHQAELARRLKMNEATLSKEVSIMDAKGLLKTLRIGGIRVIILPKYFRGAEQDGSKETEG